MNADMLLDAFEKIDDAYIIEARERTAANSAEKKGERVRRAFVLAAAIIAALALCCALLGGADGSHDWIPYDVAVLVDNVGGREREQV